MTTCRTYTLTLILGLLCFSNTSFARFFSIDPVSAHEYMSRSNPNPMGFNRYSYGNNNPYRYIDPDGRELIEVTLPGLGKTYLDDKFSPKVDKFIEKTKSQNVNLKFNSAYRTPEEQAALKKDKNAITPADDSLHSAGFAVDVNYSSLKDIPGGITGDKQRSIIKEAGKKSRLSWGGDFKKTDPPHFYSDPGNRKQLIKDAAKKYKELTK